MDIVIGTHNSVYSLTVIFCGGLYLSAIYSMRVETYSFIPINHLLIGIKE